MKNLKKRISIYILKKGAVIVLSLAKTNQENRYLIHILNSKRFQQLKNQKWKMRFDYDISLIPKKLESTSGVGNTFVVVIFFLD